MIDDARGRAGGTMGGSGRPAQWDLLVPSAARRAAFGRAGDGVTEPGRLLPPMVTGPARLARWIREEVGLGT
jgi:hypothetical protein